MSNFENHFFVDYEDGPYVNKKGIYKDSVGASQPWADYQLRCNFPITMTLVSNFWILLRKTNKNKL